MKDLYLKEDEYRSELRVIEDKLNVQVSINAKTTEEMAKLNIIIENCKNDKMVIEAKVNALKEEKEELKVILCEKEKMEENLRSDIDKIKKELLEERESKSGLVERLTAEEQRLSVEREEMGDERARMESHIKEVQLSKDKELKEANVKLTTIAEEKDAVVEETNALKVTLEAVELAKYEAVEELKKLKTVEVNFQQLEEHEVELLAVNRELENEIQRFEKGRCDRREQIVKWPTVFCRGYYSETIFIFLDTEQTNTI
jgi:chromosome segregation ATPase